MTAIPEAITKSWRGYHSLICAECGQVSYILLDDSVKAREYFNRKWKQHLEEKHSERKP